MFEKIAQEKLMNACIPAGVPFLVACDVIRATMRHFPTRETMKRIDDGNYDRVSYARHLARQRCIPGLEEVVWNYLVD